MTRFVSLTGKIGLYCYVSVVLLDKTYCKIKYVSCVNKELKDFHGIYYNEKLERRENKISNTTLCDMEYVLLHFYLVQKCSGTAKRSTG